MRYAFLRWGRVAALVAAVAAGAGPVSAETPGLYDVIGVAENDTLKIRENPRPSALIVGELPRSARGVEVVQLSENGNWGRVNQGDLSGWVSLQFLAAQSASEPGETRFDRPLLCVGGEPDWSILTSGGDGLVLNHPQSPSSEFTIRLKLAAQGRPQVSQVVQASAERASLIGVLRHDICTDAASDRTYGMTMDALLRDGGGTRLLTGCCSLDATN
ncbi:MAG: hypothetical protein AAGE76_03480 [Pseudomonadota bacterium]